MAFVAIARSTELSECPPHSHKLWEININQHGKGHMEINGKVHPFGPSSIICLPPNTEHKKISKDKFQDIYLKFTDFPLSNSDKSEVFFFQDDTEKTVETLALILNNVYHKQEENFNATTLALFDSICQILIGWGNNKRIDPIVMHIMNQIVESFTNPEFKLSNVLSDTRYSNDHVRRLFKNETSITPQKYLTELRLNYAKKLLRTNKMLNYSVAEISLMSGFYDSGYFSKVFKNDSDISPTEYMETHKDA